MTTKVEVPYHNLTADYSLEDSTELKELPGLDMRAEIVSALSKEVTPDSDYIVTIYSGELVAKYTREAEVDYLNLYKINLEKFMTAVMLIETQYNSEHPGEVFKWGEVYSLWDISVYNGPTYLTYEWELASRCFQKGYAPVMGFGEYSGRRYRLEVTHLDDNRRGVTIASILPQNT